MSEEPVEDIRSSKPISSYHEVKSSNASKQTKQQPPEPIKDVFSEESIDNIMSP